MYVPSHYAEADLPTLFDFIEQHPFGLLVSQHDGIPIATHLPFLLDRNVGDRGVLSAHVARQNPQWREFAGQKVLALFHGPHAYVSPAWYQAENVVPTWNYVAVHAYGRAELVEDRAGVLEIVRRSVAVYEAGMPRPWVLDTSPVFLDRLLPQIVGFRVAIDRIEGKWKLNQNHPVERRRKVVEALRERGGEDAAAIAEMMEGMLPPGS